jgi:hypothetical protein
VASRHRVIAQLLPGCYKRLVIVCSTAFARSHRQITGRRSQGIDSIAMYFACKYLYKEFAPFWTALQAILLSFADELAKLSKTQNFALRVRFIKLYWTTESVMYAGTPERTTVPV